MPADEPKRRACRKIKTSDNRTPFKLFSRLTIAESCPNKRGGLNLRTARQKVCGRAFRFFPTLIFPPLLITERKPGSQNDDRAKKISGFSSKLASEIEQFGQRKPEAAKSGKNL